MGALSRRQFLTVVGGIAAAGALPRDFLAEKLAQPVSRAAQTSATSTLDRTILQGRILQGSYRTLIDGPGAPQRARRARPWRLLGLLALTAVAVGLGTVLAMLLGLLVAGVLAAAITWFCVGLGGAALTIAWLRTCAPSHAVAQP